MKSGPPRELLEKVMTIADTKMTLPFRSRKNLDSWGVNCRVNRLRDGASWYQAGGSFISKLGFVLRSDGSILGRKYNPGDWELAIEPTYNYAKYLIESRIDEPEKAEVMQIGANNIEARVRILEQKAGDNPAWLHPLLESYVKARKFKDAERILVRVVEKWPKFFLTHMNLGIFYLHAIAHERGIRLSSQLSTGEWAELNIKDLGYAQGHTLVLSRQHIEEALKLAPKRSRDVITRLNAALAELGKFQVRS
jgi:hypothetical protein